MKNMSIFLGGLVGIPMVFWGLLHLAQNSNLATGVLVLLSMTFFLALVVYNSIMVYLLSNKDVMNQYGFGFVKTTNPQKAEYMINSAKNPFHYEWVLMALSTFLTSALFFSYGYFFSGAILFIIMAFTIVAVVFSVRRVGEFAIECFELADKHNVNISDCKDFDAFFAQVANGAFKGAFNNFSKKWGYNDVN